MRQITVRGLEQSVQAVIGIRPVDVRNGDAFPAQPRLRQRHQQAVGRDPTRGHVIQTAVDQIAAGQTQVGEGRPTETSADPTREGGASGDRLPPGWGEALGAQAATAAALLAEGVSDRGRQLHGPTIPRG